MQPATVVPPAFDSLQMQLRAAGMSDQAVAFILGRLLKVVSQAVLAEVETLEGLERLRRIPDVSQRQAELEAMFHNQKGKTMNQVRDEFAQKLVDDFENE